MRVMCVWCFLLLKGDGCTVKELGVVFMIAPNAERN